VIVLGTLLSVSSNAPDLFRLEVPCNSDAPFLVRDAVDRCEELSAVRQEARLIASELVTNAVLHSGCNGGDLLDVRASVRGAHLLIAVSDPGAKGQTPALRVEDDPARVGFGLRVVQQLARRSGSDRPDGQRVWAELALAP
jgi:two-component sensor histidine kinase